MKILYFDCGMGAAGDMLTAALTELLPDPDRFIDELNVLGIPGVVYRREKVGKCGIMGTQISVTVNGKEEGEIHGDEHGHRHGEGPEHFHGHGHEDRSENFHGHEHGDRSEHFHGHEHGDRSEHFHGHGYEDRSEYFHEHEHIGGHGHVHTHHHRGMAEIESIIDGLCLPAQVKRDVRAVYGLIAEAESHAHGVPVSEIHFHEVGTMDAIADITAVCLLLYKLAPDKVVASPVHVGSGSIRCAHGILPVPAPATAYILRGVPIYGGSVSGELCTPTGAALLRYFVSEFGEMPVMKTESIGYGMGKRDFERANCVRAMLGEGEEKTDMVLELSCNVDDMTAEEVGFAMERLFEGGAREVYTIPVGMKKSRPGTLIRVLCTEQEREKMVEMLFRYTTTLGVREVALKRYVLDRRVEVVDTPCGKVRRKLASGYGVTREKYEYEDLAEIARRENVSIEEIKRRVKR